MKTKFKQEVNNFTNINNTNNHLSPQITENKTYHDKWHWKSMLWLCIYFKM